MIQQFKVLEVYLIIVSVNVIIKNCLMNKFWSNRKNSHYWLCLLNNDAFSNLHIKLDQVWNSGVKSPHPQCWSVGFEDLSEGKIFLYFSNWIKKLLKLFEKLFNRNFVPSFLVWHLTFSIMIKNISYILLQNDLSDTCVFLLLLQCHLYLEITD